MKIFFRIMKIIYASQTGNSEFYAKQTARMLYERGVDVLVFSIEEYSAEILVNESSKVIFLCSTTSSLNELPSLFLIVRKQISGEKFIPI